MTKAERDERIAQILADRVMPLPRRYKAIERIMAEYESTRNPDRDRKDAERTRFEAYDSAPSNI